MTEEDSIRDKDLILMLMSIFESMLTVKAILSKPT